MNTTEADKIREQARKDTLEKSLKFIEDYPTIPEPYNAREVVRRMHKMQEPTTLAWQEYYQRYCDAKTRTLNLLRADLQRLEDAGDTSAQSPVNDDPKAAQTIETPGLVTVKVDQDLERKREINRGVMKALEDLFIGVSPEQAKDILTAIVRGKVPNVTIKY